MSEKLTVEREEYGLGLRALNVGAGALRRLGFPFGELGEASLLQSARQLTGLDDWGGEHFLEPMRIMLEDVEASGLTNLARISTRDIGVHCLATRLRITDYFKRHPHVHETKIERPVFILGFPRTGTTLLQNLLALDPDRRALPFWEILNPVPFDDDPARDAALRIKAANAKLRIAYWVMPEMAEVHEIRAESLEECWPLLACGFTVIAWDMGSGWRSYGKWLLEHDMRSSYREYKQCLQVMTQREPGSGFVLKCPDHLWFVDSLVDVFPDAAVVWTHRDPVDSIASYCSLISLNWRLMYGRFDPHEIGRHIEERFLAGIQRALAARDALGEGHFYDVDFVDLCNDPYSVLNGISDHFGIANIGKDAVDGYLATKRRDAKGKHKYSVERYGLDPERIHSRYAEYIERFQIPLRAR
ncbi:MAG: sulfotransferase [Myxococcota bacterium]|nr:sulfotransferase [Myxococcota bacterium]MEC9389268.1 sulfotransferase [Myxococcota bacterium]